MNNKKILIFLLCACLKAPAEPIAEDLLELPIPPVLLSRKFMSEAGEQNPTQSRQIILDALFAELSELSSSPDTLLQELVRKGIVPQADWSNPLELVSIANWINRFITNFLFWELEKHGLLTEIEDLDRDIKSNPGFSEILKKLFDCLKNEVRRRGRTKKDLPKYALKLARQLKKILFVFESPFESPYNNIFGNENSELRAKFLNLKGQIAITGLFALEEGDLGGMLEIAQEYFEEKAFDEPLATDVLEKMTRATRGLTIKLCVTACRYNPMLASEHLYGTVLFFSAMEISHEQHAELMYFCKKLREVSECIENLCEYLRSDRAGEGVLES